MERIIAEVSPILFWLEICDKNRRYITMGSRLYVCVALQGSKAIKCVMGRTS